MRIVFHGNTAKAFGEDFSALLAFPAQVRHVPEDLTAADERAAFAAADVIVTPRLDGKMPRPAAVRLFQCPGAGYDGIDQEMLPADATVCNCFGHEDAIGEYVLSAILMRVVPIGEADRGLRRGEWFPFWAGNPDGLHREVGGRTLALVGFGHIGHAVAARARPFGLRILVVNRTPPKPGDPVDRSFGLGGLTTALAEADWVVVTLALTPETTGFIGRNAFSAMKPDAVLINVARGPVVDEQALFEALSERRIGGAVIDTWYRYPQPGERQARPSALPFETLDNLVMTPHMSGWTTGTIARRRRLIAENVARLHRGEPLLNIVRSGARAA